MNNKIIEAACSLAALVKQHNKPVAFDMNKYIGFLIPMEPMEIDTESSPDKALLTDLIDTLSPPSQTKDFAKDLQSKINRQVLNNIAREKCTQHLMDAMTLDEVYDICPAQLLEIGMGSERFPNGWEWWAVPLNQEVFKLEL